MTGRKRNKPVLSVGAYDIGPTDAWVQDDQRYPADILPEDDSTLERTVRIGRASRVEGFIYGKWITMDAGFSDDAEDVTRAAGLYAVEIIELQSHCKIATHVQCNGEINIGSQCEIFGDVIGNQAITIGDRTRIGGNVILTKF